MSKRESREFFSERGDPETIEEAERRLSGEEYAREMQRYSFPQNTELKGLLNGIDFDILQDIFANHVKKSGIDKSNLNFIKPERINSGGALGAAGAYRAKENLIGLDTSEIERIYEGLSRKISFLLALCHEETHATSKIECYGYERVYVMGESQPPVRRQYTGYAHHEETHDTTPPFDFKTKNLYWDFDEGVTEKLAREIAQEYSIKANFASMQELEEFWQKFRKKGKIPYEKQVKLVDLLIRTISRATGFGEDIVWQSIIRGKFEGEKFSDENLRDDFARIFGGEFLEKLGNDYTNELVSCLEKLEGEETERSLNFYQRVKIWFGKYTRSIQNRKSE